MNEITYGCNCLGEQFKPCDKKKRQERGCLAMFAWHCEVERLPVTCKEDCPSCKQTRRRAENPMTQARWAAAKYGWEQNEVRTGGGGGRRSSRDSTLESDLIAQALNVIPQDDFNMVFRPLTPPRQPAPAKVRETETRSRTGTGSRTGTVRSGRPPLLASSQPLKKERAQLAAAPMPVKRVRTAGRREAGQAPTAPRLSVVVQRAGTVGLAMRRGRRPSAISACSIGENLPLRDHTVSPLGKGQFDSDSYR